MPRKPKKPCAYPGCPNLTHGKYCDAHGTLEQSEYHRQQSNFYATIEWKKKRQEYLVEHPFCVECRSKGRATAATIVDHILPIKMGGAPLDDCNLQGLCWSCHSRKSVKEGSRFQKKVYHY